MKVRKCVLAGFAIFLPVLLHASERDALLSLYEALAGDQWDHNDGWQSNAPLSEWHGITTRSGHVVQIDLAGNHLVGELPSDLGNLRHLEALDLRWNTLWGTIPDSVGELVKLETLLLSGNELTGDIPEVFGSMPALKRLDLSYNSLSGEIPAALGRSRTLQALGLQHNQLIGSLPQELSRIGTLQRLIANGNDLTAPVSQEFDQMPALTHLKVADSKSSTTSVVIPNTNVPARANVPRSGVISGLDLLDETTMIIDEEVVALIGQIMSAIVVRDGMLHIDSMTLPLLTKTRENLEDVVGRINERLREAGERVESVNDLDRTLELYGEDTIDLNLPEAENGSVFVPGANESQTPFGRHVPSSNDRIEPLFRSAARVRCPRDKTKAHYAHKSKTTPGKIIGKANVECTYYGPPQLVVYSAFVYLQKRRGWWIFSFWRPVGTAGFETERGRSVSIPQHDLIAVTTCRNGTYRTRLALYINGSYGPFYPYPGVYTSARRRVSC